MMERIRKRLLKEINSTNDITNFEQFENNISFVYKDQYLFSLTIPIGYPFYPPKNIYVNYIKVQYFDRGNMEIIRKYFKIKCLCCTSITCGNNWLPTHSLIKIAKEYDRYKGIINGSIVLRHIESKLPQDVLYHIVNYLK